MTLIYSDMNYELERFSVDKNHLVTLFCSENYRTSPPSKPSWKIANNEGLTTYRKSLEQWWLWMVAHTSILFPIILFSRDNIDTEVSTKQDAQRTIPGRFATNASPSPEAHSMLLMATLLMDFTADAALLVKRLELRMMFILNFHHEFSESISAGSRCITLVRTIARLKSAQ